MTYPNLPITRVQSFTLPDYQYLVNEDMVGVERRRSYLESGRGAKLEIFYDALTATQVLTFIEFYKEYGSRGRGFGIPQSFLEYPDKLFQEYLSVLGKTVLIFDDAPIISSDINNIYNLTINLRALEVTLESPEYYFTILSSTATLSATSSVEYVNWVQISGQAVTIETPDSLTTQIVSQGGFLTNQNGELAFKVYVVDNPDVFSLTKIVTIPTSFSAFDDLTSSGTNLREEESLFRVPLPLKWNIIPTPGSENTYYPFESFTSLNIYWESPANTQYLKKYEIEYWLNNTWVLQKTIGLTKDKTTSVPPSQTFRIISVISFDGVEEIRIPSEVINISINCANNSLAIANYLAPLTLGVTELTEEILDLKVKDTNLETVTGYNLSSEISDASLIEIPLTASELPTDLVYTNINAQMFVISGLEMVVQDEDLEGQVIG